MADTRCSYCGRLNGGHSLACSSLAQAAADDPYLEKVGWSRSQVPLDDDREEERERFIDDMDMPGGFNG
tara:strand:- start:394 stop:600 length:207 start_codon:yes stop_codon:yes gene_type:complete